LEKSGRKTLKGVKAAVIGAGGAARAIVAGLVDAGAEVVIYNRTVEKAKRLAEEFGCGFKGLGDLKNLDAEIVINCTSIGMSPKVDESPLPAESLNRNMVVFDTVYNPAETKLLKLAKRAGAKTIDGVEMFVRQAAGQFELFSGRAAKIELIRKYLYQGIRR
jgi:3-dehydroquinate dehydratase/shikimate dehydrogenase